MSFVPLELISIQVCFRLLSNQRHPEYSPPVGRARPGLPQNQVPILEVDGRILPQSNAQLRFVGKMAGAYVRKFVQNVYCRRGCSICQHPVTKHTVEVAVVRDDVVALEHDP